MMNGERALELSVRGANIAKRVGAKTVGELAQFTESEILTAKCFGMTSLEEIRAALATRGLRLGMTAAELARIPGTDAPIVARIAAPPQPVAETRATPVGETTHEEEHDHEGSCCGHCEAAARKLRAKARARRIVPRRAKAKSS